MQIEIPEPLLKRLQKNAIPFIDTTPASVIERWADFYDQHYKQKNESNVSKKQSLVEIPHGVRQFDPKRPPSLLHTRVRGEFAKTSFSNWNDMLRIAHIYAFKEAGAFEDLRKITRAQIRKGSYSD